LADNPFEIPHDLRAMMEQNVQQSHAAYEQIADLVTNTIRAWMTVVPTNPMMPGLQDIQNCAMDFAKENAESVFSLARKISSAKSPQEVLALQTEFTQDLMRSLMNQTRELYTIAGDGLHKSRHG
jgi:phasin family protein